MYESTVGTPLTLTKNSDASAQQQNFFALLPHTMSGDYPEDQDTYDMYIPSTNYIFFNKVMSGAYDSIPDKGVYPPLNRSYDGGPRILLYATLTTRDYAAVAEHVFTYVGMPQKVWATSFSQQNYVGIQRLIRGFFTRAHGQERHGAITSDNYYALELLHSRVNGCRAAIDMYGFSLWAYINSPQTGIQGIWDSSSLLYTPTPSVLPDIWVQVESRCVTKATTPLLSSNKYLTGIQMDNGQVTPIGSGSYTTPIPIDMQAREVGLETIPLVNDAALFNQRLVWHTFTASLYTLDGSTYTTSTVASSKVVAQKAMVADWTIPNLINPSILNSKTTWIPLMNESGLRLCVGVTSGNGAATMSQIMGKRSTTGVACWLVRGAEAMPNTIVDGGGQNAIIRLAKPPSSVGNDLAETQPAVISAEQDQPQVEVQASVMSDNE
jgi:hypothetical protein